MCVYTHNYIYNYVKWEKNLMIDLKTDQNVHVSSICLNVYIYNIKHNIRV